MPQTTVSMVAATPKPRVVKLEILPEAKKAIASGNTKHETVRHVVKVKIGGVTELVAPLLGKQPPDTHVWVLTGDAPHLSNWKVRSMPAVPCGELNWQLRQGSNCP
jgi:phenylpyruvate tautomerase PptA (4-oxalocrotonate tautomerase family)